ncbi:MAG: MMPL family transporter [Acidimicrobiaceae bacterium]|nr:MMPL family transporter [Acidimicrobiaceae bacterium]
MNDTDIPAPYDTTQLLDRDGGINQPIDISKGPGALGRLGSLSARRRGFVFGIWLVIIAVFVPFAPKVETALSGAGWQANGSQSVAVRQIVQTYFGGQSSSAIDVVVSSKLPVDSPSVARVVAEVENVLHGDPRISGVLAPKAGISISRDGKTAMVIGLAGADPNTMVRAADALQGPLSALSTPDVKVVATGSSVLWSDFNAANRNAMMKSELFSWPVTLVILMLAFGSLVAAGLPLLLTIVGLLSAAGMLDLLTRVTPISIWAMNFALMFALALGIDYALFIVVRFRGAHFGRNRPVETSVAETMDTAGKAVLFSGLTVLISLSSVMVVPSPAFRSMAAGIMIAVIFVLLATLTLLPAVLGKLGDRVDALALPWVHAGEHRSVRFARWGELLWRRPLIFGGAALALLLVLAAPIIGLRTAMPSIKVVPPTASARVGYNLVQSKFGVGAPGQLQIVTDLHNVPIVVNILDHNSGIAEVLPTQYAERGGYVLIDAVPRWDPSNPLTGSTITSLRSELPMGSLVGGASAENFDLQRMLSGKTTEVMGLILLLGFLLLLVALQAPLISAIGVVTSLLATGATFGVARLIFQDGWMHNMLSFTPQGFLDSWAPVFFFAMIFAISMDYTVFLLSSAKEHYEMSGDVKDAMVNGVAHSGRVIFAAAGVMVAVFFTFSLSGPLPPKEMGIILGVAVLLDAFLVRLLLLPVLLRLSGKAAWWRPEWLARILPDVRFSHG